MTWVQEEKRIILANDDIVILNISDLLPTHKRKRYGTRDARKIDRCVVHHSAGNTAPPPDGILRMGRFFIRSPWPIGRGWPGFAYTFYVPHAPEIWEPDLAWGDGRYVVYQCQPLSVWSYHTGPKKGAQIPIGANETGISILFQGSFTARRHPSDAQKFIAPRLWDLLKKAQGFSNGDLYTHAMYGKKACPGPWLSDWVQETRQAT